MKTTLALLALLLVACGSSTYPPPGAPDGDTGADPSPDTCGGYGPNDACMNEDNFAACQAREAECPGQVLVLESCPLQFACP
jgi:hypothetical protein